jgi:preprotein translocase subunit SecE
VLKEKKMKQFQIYVKECFAELGKVTWPTKEELKGSTIVVIVFSIIASIFIWATDFALSEIFTRVLG